MRYDRIKNIIQLQWCNDLEEILQCPVCFERPVKPIYQCNFGHHICSVCRGQITICPMCQKTYNGSIHIEKCVLYSSQVCRFIYTS